MEYVEIQIPFEKFLINKNLKVNQEKNTKKNERSAHIHSVSLVVVAGVISYAAACSIMLILIPK
jgi:hypothetical protein